MSKLPGFTLRVGCCHTRAPLQPPKGLLSILCRSLASGTYYRGILRAETGLTFVHFSQVRSPVQNKGGRIKLSSWIYHEMWGQRSKRRHTGRPLKKPSSASVNDHVCLLQVNIYFLVVKTTQPTFWSTHSVTHPETETHREPCVAFWIQLFLKKWKWETTEKRVQSTGNLKGCSGILGENRTDPSVLCQSPAPSWTRFSYLPEAALAQHHEEVEVGEFHSVEVVGRLSPVLRRTNDFVASRAELGFLNNKHTRENRQSFSQGRK